MGGFTKGTSSMARVIHETKTEATLRISRVQRTSEEDVYVIDVQCGRSRVGLATLELTAQQFAEAITGLSVDGVVASTRVADDRVGKEKRREWRTFKVVGCRPSRAEAEELLRRQGVTTLKTEGKHVDPYLGSQGSIAYDGDTTVLRYSVYWWE
jgi:hypothetical protein